MKELDYALNIISKTDWYRQGGTIIPILVTNPYFSVTKELGYRTLFIFEDGLHNMGYFDKTAEKKQARKYLKKYFSNPEFIEDRFNKWYLSTKKQSKLLDDLLKIKIADDWQLNKTLNNFLAENIDGWTQTVIIELFDPWGEYFLKPYIDKYTLTDEEVGILTSPQKSSFIQKELINRYQIVKNRDLSKVRQHYRKYFWYKNSWQKIYFLTEKHFQNLIVKDLENSNKIKKEVQVIANHYKQGEKNRANIIKHHKITKTDQKIFTFFSFLNDWRDLRKQESVAKTNYYLMLFLKKIAKHNKLSLKNLHHAFLWELESFSLSDKYLLELKKRLKNPYIVYFDQNKKRNILVGQKAKKIHVALENNIKLQFSTLKGRSAFGGKASGKVRIINKISDLSKIERGNILVSIMTRPELFPGIKKAAAIITDEGGITCHAAIVSRELKIPCIVGTQIATSVLKDGDLVEVDANNGIVKKLK